MLTYKGARIDASGSKPEHETRIDDPDAVHELLLGLGYKVSIAFEKRCRNYGFRAAGRDMLATPVHVPELDGTFIEVETIVPEEQLADALQDVRRVLEDLGIDDRDLTTELYTDAVAARRTR
jgi:adenylate cyclase class 2